MKDLGAIPLISGFIHETFYPYQVRLAGLNWLSQLCHENETVSTLVASEVYCGRSLLDILFDLMGQNNTHEMQFYAAKCMTYIYRSNAIYSSDQRVLFRTLPTLIMLCKKDRPTKLRAQAADVLATLTQVDVSLQQHASICDQLVSSLSDMIRQSAVPRAINSLEQKNNSNNNNNENSNLALDEPMDENIETNMMNNEIRESAFKAFASLGANDEEIRKKIIETEFLMDELMSALDDSDMKVRLAALQCLHSLSRSVSQLRTTFQDHAVWVPLRNLLQNPRDEVLNLASSCLCNLLLEFSPSKQVFVFIYIYYVFKIITIFYNI